MLEITKTASIRGKAVIEQAVFELFQTQRPNAGILSSGAEQEALIRAVERARKVKAVRTVLKEGLPARQSYE